MIPLRSALDPRRKIESSGRLVWFPKMGHAFDPIGHAAICEGVEWVLANRADPDG